MKEEQIDRRAHWIQALVTGIIVATVFCVKLQMGLTQLEQDFKDYKKEMKATIKEFDNRGDDLDRRVTHLEDWRDLSQMRK